jgi:guanylate kinase
MSRSWSPLDRVRPVFPVVVSGPSGVGKTVLVKKLLELDSGLTTSISATSRPPRGEEKDGIHYHFIDTARFETLIKDGGLLEWAQVHDHYYGTPREPLEKSLESGVGVVMNIDVQGARQVRAAREDALLIFIAPPSIEALEQRLRLRGTDRESEISLRLRNAVGELDQAVHYDYVVVNEDVDNAAARLREIVEAERHRVARLRPKK